MSIAVTVLAAFFGTWIYNPNWFDDPGYIYHSSHETLQQCIKAKLEDGDVCANHEKPFQLYVRKK